MTRIVLKEGGKAEECGLSAEVAESLRDSGFVTVRRVSTGRYRIGPRNTVGLAEVAGLEISVEPKLAVERLVFLIGYARKQERWLDENVQLADAPDLFPAVAYPFVRQVEKALRHGLLQGYHVVEETLPLVRGRILEADQLRRRHGAVMPLEVRYDDFTVDIAENQLVKAATTQLLELPRLGVDVRHRLLALLSRLRDVSPVDLGRRPTWRPRRLNQRYHVALQLADLVLDGRSFETDTGNARVNGFTFPMDRVFEDFVCVALSESLARFAGDARRDNKLRLDTEGAQPMHPDLLLYRSGRAVGVVDAKYKIQGSKGHEHDLYQVLAYCVVLDVPVGHLIYAKGGMPRKHLTIHKSGFEIVCHALDLDRPPELVLAQIDAIADEIVAGARHPDGSGAESDGR